MARNLPASTNPFRRLFSQGQQDDLFRALADRLDQPILVLTADGGRVQTCNHAFLLLTGYSRAEMESARPGRLLGGEPGARALAELLATPPGQTTTSRNVPLHTRQDGTIDVDLEATPSGADGSALLVMVQPSIAEPETAPDDSDLRRRLQVISDVARDLLSATVPTLPTALQQARLAIEASHLALYRLSASKPDYVLDGQLPETFPTTLAAKDIKSLNRNEHWQLGKRPDGPLQKAARAAEVGSLRTTLVGAESAWVGVLAATWPKDRPAPAQAQALLSVIASLCHAAIQLSLQQISSADLGVALKGLQAEATGQLNAVSDAVLSLGPGLEVVRVNQSARRLLGYPDESLEGLTVQDVLVGPEDITTTLLDALGHDRVSERPRVVLHRRDGTPFPVHLRAVPMAKDSPTRLLVVLNDQSERQAIEDQNELLAQRALLGEVSAIFAHEVRNPINNISTGIQLVASRLGQDHPLYESLDKVRRECSRLDQLMSDVLFFTRRLELKMEPVALDDMLKRLLERWMPRLRQSSVRVHTTFDQDAPEVMADPRTLEQVFINLITNALQAMEDGGTLSVTLSAGESQHAEIVRVQFADTGPGIPAEQADRIFDPFFTTKKDGTGLGLAISRRIVSAHKGSIQIESFPDAGTVFSVELPVATEVEDNQA